MKVLGCARRAGVKPGARGKEAANAMHSVPRSTGAANRVTLLPPTSSGLAYPHKPPPNGAHIMPAHPRQAGALLTAQVLEPALLL